MIEKQNHREPPCLCGRLRWVAFRLAALGVVLLPLVLLEVALRLFVAPPPVELGDPYVSFSGVSRLFVLDGDGRRYVTSESRLQGFRRQWFGARKQPGALRIFCLGGSTVQGRPYSVETSFTSWLELDLEAAMPGADHEVVNCGGISYASYRLVPILREVLEYEPDLVVIYMGHNEFLEDRTYAVLKRMPRRVLALHRVLLHLRSYSLASHYLRRRQEAETGAGSGKTVLGEKVKTKLDFENGLASYHRDEQWRQGVIEHFRHNVETMVRLCRAAGVPVILANPVCNLKDCPPFKSEHRAGLSEQQRRRLVELQREARALDWSDVGGKIELLEQAVKLDDRHAGLLYWLGRCYARLGRRGQAKEYFVAAREQDVCPLRIIAPMQDAIREIADEYHVALLDVEKLIAERTDDGIPGDEWLLDHVHPSIAGHQLIADALFDLMERMGLVEPVDGWRQAREELWRRRLESLDPTYFTHAAGRLKSLTEWSRGRLLDD